MELSLSDTLFAVLFREARAMSISELAHIIVAEKSAIEDGLSALEKTLVGGVVLLRAGDSVALGTNPLLSDFFAKREQIETSEIGTAGLEIIAILAIIGPASRARVDQIRGVNSTQSLRTLLSRGLIDRVTKGGVSTYSLSFDTLSHLGIATKEAFPQYGEWKARISKIEAVEAAQDGTDIAVADL